MNFYHFKLSGLCCYSSKWYPMYSRILSSVFPSVCSHSEAMVVSKMAVGLSESQQGKVGFLALYDLRVGVLEFVSFVNTSTIGKIPPVWAKKLPFVSHIYLGVFKTLDKQNNSLFDSIYFQDFVSFLIFLGGRCLILCLIVFFFCLFWKIQWDDFVAAVSGFQFCASGKKPQLCLHFQGLWTRVR